MPSKPKPQAAPPPRQFQVFDDALCYSDDDGTSWTPAGGIPANERDQYQEAIRAAWRVWHEKTTRRP